eukprot:116966-Chlamydomonas_euryale.AAC.4
MQEPAEGWGAGGVGVQEGKACWKDRRPWTVVPERCGGHVLQRVEWIEETAPDLAETELLLLLWPNASFCFD